MNKNSKTYRFWEILPGFFSWSTILFPIWGSFVVPKLVAYFVIAFLLYWLYQSFKSATFATIGYFKIQTSKKINWSKLYKQNKSHQWLSFDKVNHVIFVSSYKEPVDIIDMAISSLAAQVQVNLKNIHVCIGQEERAGLNNNNSIIKYFQKKYKDTFASLNFPIHPQDTPGEIAGKHTNEAWAAKFFQKTYIDTGKLDINYLTLTSCDVDTIFNPHYFSALSYYFSKTPKRYQSFWQSPIFWHHNIDKVPSPIRIIGTLGNVNHIADIQEPDGLFFNYSCYSSSFKLIKQAGFWDPDFIPEDWHIFLQTFFVTQGQVSITPIFLPTIVDAPQGKNFFDALKNRYQQCLRHAWGATDIPYAIEQSRIHTEIPLLSRLLRIFKLFKTHFIWSSNWFILTLGTSLPVIFNPRFFQTSIGYNLPKVSQIILSVCLIPLFVLIVLDWKLRPDSPHKNFKNFLKSLLYWPLMPIATLVLSVLPGLDSHTRLMFGKKLTYKTTKKK